MVSAQENHFVSIADRLTWVNEESSEARPKTFVSQVSALQSLPFQCFMSRNFIIASALGTASSSHACIRI